MSNDPVQPPRQPPRFVPTLTEVVPAGGSPAPASVPVAAPATPATPAFRTPRPAVFPSDLTAVVTDEVLRQLGPDLERLIAEAIGRALHEHMLGLNARVQREVRDVVRQAVANALTRQVHESAVGGNP